jgi:hypothetical protein
LFYWIGAHELAEPVIRSALARHDPAAALAATVDWHRAMAPERVRDISRLALYRTDAHALQGEIDTAAGSPARPSS